MNHLNRFLAILLAALMLCGMFSAVAEMEVVLDAPLDIEIIESDEDALDTDLDLDDLEDLDLEDPDLVSEAPEAAIASNATEAEEDNASPFRIKDGVLVKYTGSDANVVIPGNVVAIGKSAFVNNVTLNSVTIPSSVTEIQAMAFYGCTNLTSVTVLSSEVSILAYNAFKKTTPTFYTVTDCNLIDWARDQGFTVVANIILLERPTRMSVSVGETYRIFLNNVKATAYASDNLAVATVSQAGTVKTVGKGTALITVTLTNGTALTLRLFVTYPAASLSATSLTLNAGSSKTLSVNNLKGRSVSWSSSDNNVATVRNGSVTAVRPGSCTITAALSDGTILRCKVTVSDPAALSKSRLTLNVGQSHTLTVSGLFGRSVSWSSSNNNIATVQNGKVTARKPGSCTITAQVRNGKTLKCKVTVSDPVKLNKDKLSLKVGQYFTLKVSNLNGRSVKWSSNYPNVASVSGGKVTAKGTGKCTITARLSDGKTLTCKVTVTSNGPTLSNPKLTLRVGGTFKLVVNNLGKNKVTWESNNQNIATVDQYGTVTAVKAGKCIISARLSNGTVLQCKLTVRR